MVYVRYVNGYGPYAYYSKREEGSVKSVYLGPVTVRLANVVGKKSFTREKHREREEVMTSFEELKSRVEEEGGSLNLQTVLPDVMEKANERVVERFGGEKGVVNPSTVDYISSAVRSTDGVYKKAARLLIELTQKHPFLDGNKRTAFLCATDFLEYHGKEFKEEPEDVQKFVNEVARDNKTFQEVVRWLKEKTD